MQRLATLTALALSIALSTTACGDLKSEAADASPPDTVDASGGDQSAPEVISFSPDAESTGFSPGDEVVVTFSEPMNTSSVESAIDTLFFDVADGGFIWNEDESELTIVSDYVELATGDGLDPSLVTAEPLQLIIDSSATDKAGNALTESMHRFFSKKRMYVFAESVPFLTREYSLNNMSSENSAELSVGDTTGRVAIRSIWSFNTPDFPDGSEVKNATLSLKQNGVDGFPYSSLGAVQVFHVHANPPTNSPTGVIVSAFNNLISPTPLGLISQNNNAEEKTLDVTDAFLDDLANKENRDSLTQFRTQFPTSSDNDSEQDSANFSRAESYLQIEYWVD